jgi:hypothetical protein
MAALYGWLERVRKEGLGRYLLGEQVRSHGAAWVGGPER